MNIAALLKIGLPIVLPHIFPVLKNIVGNSGAKDLINMLEGNQDTIMPLITGLLDKFSNGDGVNSVNSDSTVKALLEKIPNGNIGERLYKLEADNAEIKGMIEMVLNMIGNKK